MSHTPGPWRVSCESSNQAEAECIEADNKLVAWTANTWDPDAEDGEGAEIITEEDRANGRLICAAPELFEACQLLVALEDSDAHNADSRWKTARKMMRTAISKVEGKN